MQILRPKNDPVEKIFAGLAAEAEREAKNYRTPAKRFRASEVADCRRKIWYRLAGFRPLPLEPWIKLVGESGGLHHDYFRYLAKHYDIPLKAVTYTASGKQIEDDYVVKDFIQDGVAFKIAARADAVAELEVTDPVTGLDTKVDAVTEIKSMGHFDHDAYQRAWKKGDDKLMETILEKHTNYIWQGNATALVRGLDYVWLVLIGRSGCSIGLTDAGPIAAGQWQPLRGKRAGGLVWRMEESDKTNLLTKLADIQLHLNQGDPPPADYVDGSKPCNQCAFWTYCHGKKKKAVYPL